MCVVPFIWFCLTCNVEFENSKNPFLEKRNTILVFKQYISEVIHPDPTIEVIAKAWQSKGLKLYDSLHMACAIFSGCDYFLTVYDGVLNKRCSEIKIVDPVIFINQWLKKGATND